jgi:hypothetical protein
MPSLQDTLSFFTNSAAGAEICAELDRLVDACLRGFLQ